MAIRVEVLAGGEIEIMHADVRTERNVFHRTADAGRAKVLFSYWLEREIAAEARTRFLTQRQKEAKEAWKQLQEKNPYGKK